MRELFLVVLLYSSFLVGGPVVTAHFGAADCPWSQQLREKVWDTPSFRTILENAAIQLQEGSLCESEEPCPALIVYHASGDKIGHLDSIMVGPEGAAQAIIDMVSLEASLRSSLAEVSSEALIHLYRKAQLFHMDLWAERLLDEGMGRGDSVAFWLEGYAQHIQAHPRRARKLKQQIRALWPDQVAVEWELALLAFRAHHQDRYLNKFLRRFGEKYPDYAWRCHVLLMQYYRDRQEFAKADKHAQQAWAGAPESLQHWVSPEGIHQHGEICFDVDG